MQKDTGVDMELKKRRLQLTSKFKNLKQVQAVKNLRFLKQSEEPRSTSKESPRKQIKLDFNATSSNQKNKLFKLSPRSSTTKNVNLKIFRRSFMNDPTTADNTMASSSQAQAFYDASASGKQSYQFLRLP